MRKVTILSAKVALCLLLAFVLAQLWWYLWMYHGWIGTPRILHRFVFSDGEASYDNTLFEMFVISGLGALAAYYLMLRPLGAVVAKRLCKGRNSDGRI